MSQALYRKYRSKKLSEIVGQAHITRLLERALKRGAVAHAYLLTGPRGVGKTSIARILAHEINNLPYTDESTHLDIIEIDAASNNSVEDIRDLRDKVQIAPVSAPKKVYIIDEVHMLSKSAFNALLKTLEEPPEHVVFILATTDADKLPATILSRVQRFNFRLISEADVVAHLRAIAEAERIAIDDDALRLIAEQGQGSFRDSISLLDQLQHVADGAITAQLIEESLGLASAQDVDALLAAAAAGDIAAIVQQLGIMEHNGVPAPIAAEQIARNIRCHAITHPERLMLLDPLAKVTRSPWPYTSLLVALTSQANIVTQPIATATALSGNHTVKSTNSPARVKEPALCETPQASKKPPEAPIASPRARTGAAAKSGAAPPQKSTTPIKDDKSSAVSSASAIAPASNKENKEEKSFVWDDFLAPLKESAAGAHSILAKCKYHYDGATLTIYAGKKFAKTQIDKALPALAESLQTIGLPDIEITVLAAPKPPEDSQTAAIIAMMGGGEEVSL